MYIILLWIRAETSNMTVQDSPKISNWANKDVCVFSEELASFWCPYCSLPPACFSFHMEAKEATVLEDALAFWMLDLESESAPDQELRCHFITRRHISCWRWQQIRRNDCETAETSPTACWATLHDRPCGPEYAEQEYVDLDGRTNECTATAKQTTWQQTYWLPGQL